MISVVIPTFNRAHTTRDAVASVLSQTRLCDHALEIIVVDDASNVPISNLPADPRVSCLRLPRNVGPSGARNAGLAATSGEYIAFLDSDDRWLPQKLSTQLSRLNEAVGAGYDKSKTVIASGFFLSRPNGTQIEARHPMEASTVQSFASGCWFSPGSTFFAHRSVFETVGEFDPGLRRLEDFDWFVRFALAGGRLAVCGEPLALVAPSGSAPLATVQGAVSVIESKLRNGPFQALDAQQRRRLRAYLDLELAAANILQRRYLAVAFHLVRSFLGKPRTRTPLENFWKRTSEVPHSVQQGYAQMRLTVSNGN